MASTVDERLFIEQQMDHFHSFMDELKWYRGITHTMLRKLGYKKVFTTVSIYTNFRATLWHFKKFISVMQNTPEAHTQYKMMLEHLNRAIIDALIDTLNKMYYIHSKMAYACAEHLKKDDESLKYTKPVRQKIELRLKNSKTGYLNAREALLLLRNRNNEWKPPILALFDFKNPDEDQKNKDYYFRITSLFAECYDDNVMGIYMHK